MNLKHYAVAGIFALGAAVPAVVSAADAEAGKAKAAVCAACHGQNGLAQIPTYPNLAGQNEQYLVSALKAYKNKQRSGGQAAIMQGQAAALSDTDIANLAAWYSGHTVEVDLKQDPVRAPEQCVACHGADGLHLLEDAPNLAGETNIYIDTQLKAFRNGKRVHEIMTPIAQELSDEEIRAIADWYAAVGLKITMVE